MLRTGAALVIIFPTPQGNNLEFVLCVKPLFCWR
jgi:hypothetical protein